MKSGFTAIIGRPSAGKSTLLNKICGQKVAITSPIPQTTRNSIKGIFNSKEGQIVFIDTPGYHQSEMGINKLFQKAVFNAKNDSDLLLYVIDCTREPGAEEKEIIEILSKGTTPLIVAINKIDSTRKMIKETREFVEANLKPVAIIETSAVTGKGLDALAGSIYAELPEGHPFYPEEFYTDQTPDFRISEIIREKAISKLEREIPHCLYVEICDMEMRGDKSKRLHVRAFLVVETESQKGIVIGAKGSRITKIRHEALYDLNSIFPYKVKLDLRVKVNPKWRKKDYLIKGLYK